MEGAKTTTHHSTAVRRERERDRERRKESKEEEKDRVSPHTVDG